MLATTACAVVGSYPEVVVTFERQPMQTNTRSVHVLSHHSYPPAYSRACFISTGGQPFADWLFAKGSASGFNTFRFFAIGDNNGAPAVLRHMAA